MQNKDGEIQSALVNTEVRLTLQDGFSYAKGEEIVRLNERPCYLLVEKNTDTVYLALQSYDGEDYFILYV